MKALLDVSFLIAAFDENHVSHATVREWLQAHIQDGWSSCAITQNGFVRIISQPRYPNRLTPEAAIARLARACDSRHHTFRRCETSITDTAQLRPQQIHGPSQVTDAYLLTLAAHHGDRLVTLDHRVSIAAVQSATQDHLVVL